MQPGVLHRQGGAYPDAAGAASLTMAEIDLLLTGKQIRIMIGQIAAYRLRRRIFRPALRPGSGKAGEGADEEAELFRLFHRHFHKSFFSAHRQVKAQTIGTVVAQEIFLKVAGFIRPAVYTGIFEHAAGEPDAVEIIPSGADRLRIVGRPGPCAKEVVSRADACGLESMDIRCLSSGFRVYLVAQPVLPLLPVPAEDPAREARVVPQK